MGNKKLRNLIGASAGRGSSTIGRGRRVLQTTAMLVATGGLSLTATGCIEDTDCGVCDPNKLVLESLTGFNYANRKIHILTGDAKDPKFFIEDLVECDETEDAIGSLRGPESWCKISPIMVFEGLELVFNNLLDGASTELIRKDPSNPKLFQVYDWKTQILEIQGPITRYNGDYVAASVTEPERVSRRIN